MAWHNTIDGKLNLESLTFKLALTEDILNQLLEDERIWYLHPLPQICISKHVQIVLNITASRENVSTVYDRYERGLALSKKHTSVIRKMCLPQQSIDPLETDTAKY